eukprot:gene3944-723_t
MRRHLVRLCQVAPVPSSDDNPHAWRANAKFDSHLDGLFGPAAPVIIRHRRQQAEAGEDLPAKPADTKVRALTCRVSAGALPARRLPSVTGAAQDLQQLAIKYGEQRHACSQNRFRMPEEILRNYSKPGVLLLASSVLPPARHPSPPWRSCVLRLPGLGGIVYPGDTAASCPPSSPPCICLGPPYRPPPYAPRHASLAPSRTRRTCRPQWPQQKLIPQDRCPGTSGPLPAHRTAARLPPTAPPRAVRQIFSMDNASAKEAKAQKVSEYIMKYGYHPMDTASDPVQGAPRSLSRSHTPRYRLPYGLLLARLPLLPLPAMHFLTCQLRPPTPLAPQHPSPRSTMPTPPALPVAILSMRIYHINLHLMQHRKDKKTIKELRKLSHRRRKVLRSLRSKNVHMYWELVKEFRLFDEMRPESECHQKYGHHIDSVGS